MYACSNNCGHTSNKFFGLCPKCKEGMGEQVPDKIQTAVSGRMSKPREEFTDEIEFKTVDPNIEEFKAKIKTQFKSLNEVLSSAGGFVESQVVVLGASPGTGKSTLLSQICNEGSLYISSEESSHQVNNRMIRVNPESKAQLLSTTSIEVVLEAISRTDANFIVVDSINSIDFGVGYQTTAKYANEITKLIKDLGKVCVIISQVSKSGEISGMESLKHVVDTILHMEKSPMSGSIILSSSKNRFGDVGRIAVFQHAEKGLEQISVDQDELSLEIGTTYSDSLFGHKKLTISVESLVVDAMGAYGMKRSNGYNNNMMIQIIGVLSFNAKIDFTQKDIYLQIANGLSTDDVNIQLAVANAILSSYKKKAIIEKANGEIKLNGYVRNGSVVSNGKRIEIGHIKDLINLYNG